MQSKKLKTLLTIALSLAGCAGTAPKQERPVKFYGGVPEQSSMCRVEKAALVRFVQKIARNQVTKDYAAQAIDVALAKDALECIKADEKRFATLVGIPADDL